MTTPLGPQTFNQGDVLVLFAPFPQQPPPGQRPRDPKAFERNGFWGKARPVVLVSHGKHNRMDDILVALLTTNVATARRRGEYVLLRWREAGLDEESALRPRLYQAVKADILARPGTLHADDRPGMIAMLKDLFNL